jgi:hypothetical protein
MIGTETIAQHALANVATAVAVGALVLLFAAALVGWLTDREARARAREQVNRW